MKKRRIRLLASLLCFLLIFVRPMTALAEISIPEKTEINLMDSSGTITQKTLDQTYRFRATSASLVSITFADFTTKVNGARVTIYEEQTRKEITSTLLAGSKTTFSCYLMTGSYRLRVQYAKRSGTTGGVQHKFTYLVEPQYEDFPETKGNTDDTYETASTIMLNKWYQGCFCINERSKMAGGSCMDVYKFTVPYFNMNNYVKFSTDTSLSWTIVSVEEPTEVVYSGTTTDTDYTYQLAPVGGEFYLNVFSKEEQGPYRFMFEFSPAGATTKDLGSAHVSVGDTINLGNELNSWGNDFYNVLHEEAEHPDLFSMHNFEFKGLKAGTSTYNVFGKGSKSGTKMNYRGEIRVEFTDVEYNYKGNQVYYYDPVYWAVDAGITGGIKDKDGLARRFNPQGDCTRAQMISFLWRMEGCPEPFSETTFKDVKETDYFYKAVCWANERGITGGYSDGTFRPQGKCTRAQAVSFLYRIAGAPDVTIDSSSTFSDIHPGDGAYYNNAVVWAAQNYITGGYADGTFRPQGTCSRAQMVTFLYRYISKDAMG